MISTLIRSRKPIKVEEDHNVATNDRMALLEELRKYLADKDKDFEIDYSTLIFLYQSMGDPKGTGIETARKMAKFENYNNQIYLYLKVRKEFREDFHHLLLSFRGQTQK